MLYYKSKDYKKYEGFFLEEQIERLFGRVCFYRRKLRESEKRGGTVKKTKKLILNMRILYFPKR